MKKMLNVRALITLSVLAVSAAVGLNAQTTVQFESGGVPSFVRHEQGVYPEKTASFISTFHLQVKTGDKDIVLPVFTFADTDITGRYIGHVSATVYQNGVPYFNLSWASFSIEMGADATSTDNFGHLVVHAGQKSTLEMKFDFGVSDQVFNEYGIKINGIEYIPVDENALVQIAVFSGIEWTAGNVPGSAIPEPSTYAAIAGTAMFGIAFLKRRKLVQKT